MVPILRNCQRYIVRHGTNKKDQIMYSDKVLRFYRVADSVYTDEQAGKHSVSSDIQCCSEWRYKRAGSTFAFYTEIIDGNIRLDIRSYREYTKVTF